MVITPLLTVAGAALLFKSDASTSNAKLIGYQILVGVSLDFRLVYRSDTSSIHRQVLVRLVIMLSSATC